MKTIIIPDIHQRVHDAQRILDRENPVGSDEVVFLGDFFDDFNDTVDQFLAAGRFLVEMQERGFTTLLGNHDLAYAAASQRCSGWTPAKQAAFDAEGLLKAVEKMPIVHASQGWVFTHAGVGEGFARYLRFIDAESPWEPSVFKKGGWLAERLHRTLWSQLWASNGHPVTYVTAASGGRDEYDGCLWHRPALSGPYAEGIKQIFGHTPAAHPRSLSVSGYTEAANRGLPALQDPSYWRRAKRVCLDTNLRYYGIIQDGEFSLRENFV